MGKPLELTIYPPIHRPRYGYGIDPCREQWKRERKIIEAKRLTDTELAAEYHAAWAEMLDVPKDERYPHERPRIDTLHRFATLPHYDEAQ